MKKDEPNHFDFDLGLKLTILIFIFIWFTDIIIYNAASFPFKLPSSLSSYIYACLLIINKDSPKEKYEMRIVGNYFIVCK